MAECLLNDFEEKKLYLKSLEKDSDVTSESEKIMNQKNHIQKMKDVSQGMQKNKVTLVNSGLLAL